LKVYSTLDRTNKFEELLSLNQTEKLYSVDILHDTMDLIAYGSSNGSLKLLNIQHFDSNHKRDELIVNVNDRILRTVFSPSKLNIAIRTAGIRPHPYLKTTSPLRIFDLET